SYSLFFSYSLITLSCSSIEYPFFCSSVDTRIYIAAFLLIIHRSFYFFSEILCAYFLIKSARILTVSVFSFCLACFNFYFAFFFFFIFLLLFVFIYFIISFF